jgi:probable aminopeptidase NPEPL1
VTHIAFPSTLPSALRGAETVLVLVPEKPLKAGWLGEALAQPWAVVLEKAAAKEEAGPQGKTLVLVNPEKGPERIVLGILPDAVSRHNCPARADAVYTAAAAAGLSGKTAAVIACLDEEAHALPVARALARALPLFSRTSKKPGNGKKDGARKHKPKVAFFAMDREGCAVALAKPDREIVERSRWAAELVDTPTAEMTTADFEKAVRKAARGLEHVRVKAIVGPALLEKKLGGIHAVGRTATVAPRLVLIEYRPPKAKHHLGLVGKGVVYDTGGLSLKSSTGMSGMKCDMGGAAAAAGATLALAAAKVKTAVTCALPLAENAIGPKAYRPDDILTMHSGKTVEINNTDAEGRLLLGDAVSYVSRRYQVDAVVDAATLTGAVVISTGIRHAGVVSNREGLEQLAVQVGKATGDLVAPLPFAPEFFQKEFESKVADMKNSVANRMNAQSSCAAQFVYSHIQELDQPWLHVDLAGPAFLQDRATGYGVALLAGIVRSFTPEAARA